MGQVPPTQVTMYAKISRVNHNEHMLKEIDILNKLLSIKQPGLQFIWDECNTHIDSNFCMIKRDYYNYNLQKRALE